MKGFDVVMPNAYAVWEKIQEFLNPEFKAIGARNAYFPLVIPESLLKKEAEHFEGFIPEVAWITHGGSERLGDKLAVRPTSETIINYMFSLWIRSYQDLPMQVNQWCSVVRWETKMTKPFIRGREFLWQEGHTAFATPEEAAKNVLDVLDIYRRLLEERLKIACFFVKRPEWDKFAGAVETISLETLMPDGKVLQAGTAHNMGTNFSKPFDITFLDEKNQKKNVYQTTWGVSTRLLGALVMTHGDDKGLVMPFAVAPIQVVIIPIVFKGKEAPVMEKCGDAKKMLENAGFTVKIDASDKRPGEKHYYWELMGAPVRIEIGPKDVEAKRAVVVTRLGGEKKEVAENALITELQKVAETMDQDLLFISAKHLKENIKEAKTLADVEKVVKSGGIAKAPFCSVVDGQRCDEDLKEKTSGEVRGTLYPHSEKPKGGKCVVCGKEAKEIVYIAKAY
jgi:prolyl-tRNA synthetase